MRKYKTKSGDAWDKIAKEMYGDESYISFLMSNNQECLDFFIFPAGIELIIPEIPEDTDDEDFPDWRD